MRGETVNSIFSFLFNANSLNYDIWYGRDIDKLILGSYVLQNVTNEVTIYRGDILANQYVDNIRKKEVLVSELLKNMVDAKKAEYALMFEDVYVWTISELYDEIAEKLNNKLLEDMGYLGMVKVDEEHSWHRLFYLDLLMKSYIISKDKMILLVTEIDDYSGEIEFMKSFGFEQIELQVDGYGY